MQALLKDKFMLEDKNFKMHLQELDALNKKIERRKFLKSTAGGLGAMALGSLLSSNLDVIY